MLEQFHDLAARRPYVTFGLIGGLVFGVVLLILAVALSGSGSPQPQTVAQQEQQAEQSAAGRHETVVKVDTQSAQSTQTQPSQTNEQTQASPQQAASQAQDSSSGSADQAQQATPAADDQQQLQQAQAEPVMVAGFEVQALSDVLVEEIDEERLVHGSDGSEGGILPVANGVVPSSGPDYQTTWELIVPSASLKSAIVRVGKTPSGAMGSPDNPHVVGWLDSSAAPGETGNTLLAGHRDFEDLDGNIGTGVCWDLIETEVGDQMLVRDVENDIYYIYSVTEAVTVNPYDPASARYLKNTPEPVVTLITCEGSFNAETHQYSHRHVVVGVLAAVAAPDA